MDQGDEQTGQIGRIGRIDEWQNGLINGSMLSPQAGQSKSKAIKQIRQFLCFFSDYH